MSLLREEPGPELSLTPRTRPALMQPLKLPARNPKTMKKVTTTTIIPKTKKTTEKMWMNQMTTRRKKQREENQDPEKERKKRQKKRSKLMVKKVNLQKSSTNLLQESCRLWSYVSLL